MSGCNSSPLPVDAMRAFTAATSSSDTEAGDWLICGLEEVLGEEGVGEGRGVENAPVDDFCNRSNSSCSFCGRRGGEGPVENEPAERRGVVVKKRRVGNATFRGRRRDMMLDVARLRLT